MKIAYLINIYPKVSHSFIRREIAAIERQGVEVVRIALRGWDEELVDEADRAERSRTRYVLRQTPLAFFGAILESVLRHPKKTLGALRLAMRMSRFSDRPWPVHLIYFAEASLIGSWLRKSGVHHLHAHFGTNSAEIAMLVRVLGGPPWSFTAHGTESFDNPLAIGLGEKVARADFVVAVSQFGRSQLCRLLPMKEWSKTQVVHCGLDPDFLESPKKILPHRPRLVCVGRLSEEKGQTLLILAALKIMHRFPEFELVLAGDGPMRSQLETLIFQNNLNSRIRITGWLSNTQVKGEILESKALVLPSFAEGLPVVLMEAMALARPVIATSVGGISELVTRDVGWLVPAGSVDSIADALAECLSAPLDALVEMGRKGRDRVIREHDVNAEAKKLIDLFQIPANAKRGSIF